MFRMMLLCVLLSCCAGCSVERPPFNPAEVAAASWLACAVAAPEEAQAAVNDAPDGRAQAIVFGAKDWCLPFVKLERMILDEMPKREWTIGDDGDIRLIDISHRPDFIKQYQIEMVPLVILVRIADGKELIVKRVSGEDIPRDAAGFAKMLNKQMPGGWRRAEK